MTDRQILSNASAIAVALEQANNIGVLPNAPVWQKLDRNSIGRFGAAIETVAPNPIDLYRQRRKGKPTNLTSGVEFETDMTLSSFTDFADGFCFARGTRTELMNMEFTAVAQTRFTLANNLDATSIAKIPVGSIVYVEYDNGVKFLASTSAAATANSITINGNRAAGTGKISVVGFHIALPAQANTVTEANGRMTLTVANATGTALKAAKLTPGQILQIGAFDANGNVVNGIDSNAGQNDIYGWGRVVEVNDTSVVLDKLSKNLGGKNLASNNGNSLDVLFGDFYRNLALDDDDFIRNTYTFELYLREFVDNPNPALNPLDAYYYAVGNVPNTMSFNLPLTEKATINYAFVGTTAENITTVRKTNADSASDIVYQDRYSTANEIARLRLANLDDDGLANIFKSGNIVIGNNATPENALGTLGAKFINIGDFEVDLTGQSLFTKGDIIEAIRCNVTGTFDYIMANSDGVIALDIPELTVQGGTLGFPEDATATIDFTGQSHGSQAWDTSVGISTIPVPVPVDQC